MRKYIYEADKKQLEKPTEPKYMFCHTAQVTVYAETEAEAKKLAEEKLCKANRGTGIVWSEARLVASYDLPIDWSYGYGDERQSGDFAGIKNPCGNYVIR